MTDYAPLEEAIKLARRLVNPTTEMGKENRAYAGNFGVQLSNMTADFCPTYWIRIWDVRDNDRLVLDSLIPIDRDPNGLRHPVWDKEAILEFSAAVRAALVLDELADIE